MSIRWMRAAALLVGALVAVPGYGITPTREERTVEVTVQWYESKDALAEFCHAAGAWPGFPLDVVKKQRRVGCALYFPDRKACVVHVLRPRNTDDDRTLVFGHEVLHCFLGAYH